MEDLTFGEQVKIILGRKGMTIKELAETIEAKTGKKMSRQNLTQRLGRDNFQEQDMRMIARILECPFQLRIMGTEPSRQQTDTVHEDAAYEPAYEQEAQEAAAEQAEVQAPEMVYEETAADTAQVQAAEEEAETQTAEEPAAVSEKPADAGSWAAATAQEEPETEAFSEAEMETAETGGEELESAWNGAADGQEDGSGQIEDEQEVEAAWGRPQAELSDEEWAASTEESQYSDSDVGPDERDMTIGELYDIHEELTQLEENAKAGESVEAIKEELEKPKRDWFRGNFFLRRKKKDEKKEAKEPVHETVQQAAPEPESYEEEPRQEEPEAYQEDEREFEPVISHQDAEEDREAGDVNPYTGKEYQSNSVRMHPTRIGYVQVYDRSIHKWTDMTEWAFLGYQERKKALLGSAYEPPIYLD